MNVIVVDDEQIILQTEAHMIKNTLSNADVQMFSYMDDALDFAKNKRVDIAFLDINLEVDSGIDLAKKLQKLNPEINIIFCTGYSEYSLEALDLYCSAYLMKPLTEEKLQKALGKLRYPVLDKTEKPEVHCFGNFELMYKGIPVKFKYGKTKEMFAYLIDRNGAMIGLKEIMAAIFEEDDKESYMRNIKADLINTFRLLGIENVLVQEWGKIGVNKEMLICDYYEYLQGNQQSFHGEYMSQYSFAEETLAKIV